MSLRSCVICIAGDLKQDVFAPATWEDADIERYCKQRDITLVWEEMNKSVTHLVISRAAFKSNHAAVKYVQKDIRQKEKAKIVTYDWLEDSWAASKAIQDMSAYHPGKPRDIDSMVAVCSKRAKATKCKLADNMAAPEKEGRSEAVSIKRQDQIQPNYPTPSTLKAANQEKLEGNSVEKSSSSFITSLNTQKHQDAPHKPILFTKQPMLVSVTQTEKKFSSEKLQVKKTPANVSSTGLSWTAEHKPRTFCDKTDQFKYCIELTHRERAREKWVLMLLKAPDVVDKAFLFRAFQYNPKGKIDLNETNSPPSTFQKALELFKTSFYSKMGYPWDERLVRAGHGQQGKWRYKIPRYGEPTGQVPPELDPGHPKFVKREGLEHKVQANVGKRAIETDVSELLSEWQPIVPDAALMQDRLINEKKVSKSPCTYQKAQKGKLKQVYLSKVRKSSQPTSLKRQAEESLGPARQTKVNKIGRNKFKSSEFVDDSDTDDDSPQVFDQKTGPAYRNSAL